MKPRLISAAAVLGVVLSTLFTHQHYLLDPVGGIALSWIGYRFGISKEK